MSLKPNFWNLIQANNDPRIVPLVYIRWNENRWNENQQTKMIFWFLLLVLVANTPKSTSILLLYAWRFISWITPLSRYLTCEGLPMTIRSASSKPSSSDLDLLGFLGGTTVSIDSLSNNAFLTIGRDCRSSSLDSLYVSPFFFLQH